MFSVYEEIVRGLSSGESNLVSQAVPHNTNKLVATLLKTRIGILDIPDKDISNYYIFLFSALLT